MRTRLSIVLAFVSLALLAAGCRRRAPAPPELDGWEDWEPPPAEIPEPYNDGTLTIELGAQAGTMGDIVSYEAQAVASNASYYGTGASVRLDSLGDDWWVMSYVSISNLDIVHAAPGTYRTTSGTWTETDPYLSVTGCSGPSYGNYTFDGGSQDAEITITENEDGSRTLEFLATFQMYDGALHEAAGTIVYRQGEVAPPTTYAPVPIVLSDAEQDGDMGLITDFAGPATPTAGEYYGNGASIRLDSVGDGWWVMSYLNVSNLDLRSAPAGTYRSTSATWSETEPNLSVTGCSGPEMGNYTFDGGSDETEIVITDNDDGSRSVDLTATFSGQIARARFRYSIDPDAMAGLPPPI